MILLNNEPGLMNELCSEILNLKNECYCPERIKSKSEITRLLNNADYFKKKTNEMKSKSFDLLVDGVKVRTLVTQFPNKRPKMG